MQNDASLHHDDNDNDDQSDQNGCMNTSYANDFNGKQSVLAERATNNLPSGTENNAARTRTPLASPAPHLVFRQLWGPELIVDAIASQS